MYKQKCGCPILRSPLYTLLCVPPHLIFLSSNDGHLQCFQVSVTMTKLPWSLPCLWWPCVRMSFSDTFGNRMYTWTYTDLITLVALQNGGNSPFSPSWAWKSQGSTHHKYLPWPAELYYFWTHHCILMGVKRHLIPLSICISLITGLSSLTFELPLLENAHLCSFKVYLLST